MTEQAKLIAGGKTLAIVPNTFEDCQRIARAAIAAGIGPRGYRDDAETALGKATTAIMTGLELGVPPMQSLQNIAVINGRPQVWGELVPALLWSNGFKLHTEIQGEGDERKAIARVTRPDGDVIERTFTVKQAKEAKLWDTREKVKRKNKKSGNWEDVPNDSPWFLYQEDMLIWKAVARASKFGAADVLKGLAIREDMIHPNQEPIDVTPKDTVEDIPDIPEETIEDVPDIEQVEDTDQIADADGLIEQIKADIAVAVSDKKPKDRVAEVAEQYEDLIERLPESHRGEAHKLLEDAA